MQSVLIYTCQEKPANKGDNMGKRNKALKAKSARSTADIARQNALELADTFKRMGIYAYVREYNPIWEYPEKNPRTISVCIVEGVTDSEGNAIRFMFSHRSGKALTEFNRY